MKQPQAKPSHKPEREPVEPKREPVDAAARPHKPISQGVIPSRQGISWSVIRVKPVDEGSLSALAGEMKPGEFKECAVTDIPVDLLRDQTHKFECAGVFRAAEDGMLGIALGYKD